RLDRYLQQLPLSPALLVVTNPTVRALYGEAVAASLGRAGYRVAWAVVPDGEEAKSLAVLDRLYDEAFAAGLDRRAAVLALGGGVVGDVAGLLAATYMRGIAFVQLPTTLLAQVDASVGGKVAVNHPRGKNLIGAFHQPRLVLADVETLATLPPREWRCGLAEVVKYGVIRDAGLFGLLEEKAHLLRRYAAPGEPDGKTYRPDGGETRDMVFPRQEGDGEGPAGADAPDPEGEAASLLEKVVARCCRIKAEIVARDEREEEGLRSILNFGHTVGHA
ncbi:MAG: iron-containing alcohol dehydrogenase, partial [Firmicutes bacterium]|nr:iron-containing alcohol dehydrogenase [Bacillota bacterium]